MKKWTHASKFRWQTAVKHKIYGTNHPVWLDARMRVWEKQSGRKNVVLYSSIYFSSYTHNHECAYVCVDEYSDCQMKRERKKWTGVWQFVTWLVTKFSYFIATICQRHLATSFGYTNDIIDIFFMKNKYMKK